MAEPYRLGALCGLRFRHGSAEGDYEGFRLSAIGDQSIDQRGKAWMLRAYVMREGIRVWNRLFS